MQHKEHSIQRGVPSSHPIQDANDEPVTDQFLPLPFLTRMPYRLLPYRLKNVHVSTPRPSCLSGSWPFDHPPEAYAEGLSVRQKQAQKSRPASDCETIRIATPRPPASSAVHNPVFKNTILQHLSCALKVLGITLLFLVDLPIESVLLAHLPTYQIVDLVIVLVLYSNVLGITIQRHYHLTVDLLKTTLHLKSIKRAENSVRRVHLSTSEHLNSIHDTTAYLKALKVVFWEKEQSQ